MDEATLAEVRGTLVDRRNTMAAEQNLEGRLSEIGSV